MAEKDLGLKKETAGALTVLFGFTLIVPVVAFFLSKDKFIKFWAVQAFLTYAILEAIYKLLSIPVLFFGLGAGLIFVTAFILTLFMTYKAWQGEEWEVPVLGKISRDLLKKIK